MSLGDFVIYTAVFGEYDYVPSPRGIPSASGVSCICFTDRPEQVPSGWSAIRVETAHETGTMANRLFKLFPHLYLSDYDSSLYIDASVALKSDPRPFIERYLQEAPIAIPRHPERDCVYDEALACVEVGKADPFEVEGLLDEYRRAGMPRKIGLTENFLIARRHMDPAAIELAERWWQALERGPQRDQLHLPYIAWRYGVPMKPMAESAKELRWLLRRLPHRAKHGRFRQGFYRALSRHYDNPLGNLMEQGLMTYDRIKGLER